MDSQTFKRDDLLFSLCGLNCQLCPMFIRGDCTGCRAGSWCASSCRIAPCSVRHGNIDYCFECSEYPCPKYDGIDLRDSLISHRNQKKDLEKAKRIGIEAYREEQRTKAAILHQMLDEFDDGTMDVFYCLAVNMLSADDAAKAVDYARKSAGGALLEEKACNLKRALQTIADEKDIPLELRIWDGPW